MADFNTLYPIPENVNIIPPDLLDLRPDDDIDRLMLNPPPVISEKNVWFYWDKGFAKLYPYAQRNIRAWHRRLSPLGWTIRVVDVEVSPKGPGHISSFLDTSDTSLFPRSFHENTIDGQWRGQLTSDLTRFPLLLVHGGIYADVTTLQVGDVDKLWNDILANPASPFEVAFYNFGDPEDTRTPFNYFIGARPNNPYLERCNRLLLALWGRDGGRTNSVGMCKDPLMEKVPPTVPATSTREYFANVSAETLADIADYAVQMMVMTLVLGLVDVEGNWDGPAYTINHVYGLYYQLSTLIEARTGWNGTRAYQLLSLALPKSGEAESEDQKAARALVEELLQHSFAVKLPHSSVGDVLGATLGMLWRKHEGSDNVGGTYAHWLRYGMVHWTQEHLPERMKYDLREPFKVGRLLEA